MRRFLKVHGRRRNRFVRVPIYYNPGKGAKVHKLAYIDPDERLMLREIAGGKATRGHAGVEAYPPGGTTGKSTQAATGFGNTNKAGPSGAGKAAASRTTGGFKSAAPGGQGGSSPKSAAAPSKSAPSKSSAPSKMGSQSTQKGGMKSATQGQSKSTPSKMGAKSTQTGGQKPSPASAAAAKARTTGGPSPASRQAAAAAAKSRAAAKSNVAARSTTPVTSATKPGSGGPSPASRAAAAAAARSRSAAKTRASAAPPSKGPVISPASRTVTGQTTQTQKAIAGGPSAASRAAAAHAARIRAGTQDWNATGAEVQSTIDSGWKPSTLQKASLASLRGGPSAASRAAAAEAAHARSEAKAAASGRKAPLPAPHPTGADIGVLGVPGGILGRGQMSRFKFTDAPARVGFEDSSTKARAHAIALSNQLRAQGNFTPITISDVTRDVSPKTRGSQHLRNKAEQDPNLSTTGSNAFDMKVAGMKASELARQARMAGFTGIGTYRNEQEPIHADVRHKNPSKLTSWQSDSGRSAIPGKTTADILSGVKPSKTATRWSPGVDVAGVRSTRTPPSNFAIGPRPDSRLPAKTATAAGAARRQPGIPPRQAPGALGAPSPIAATGRRGSAQAALGTRPSPDIVAPAPGSRTFKDPNAIATRAARQPQTVTSLEKESKPAPPAAPRKPVAPSVQRVIEAHPEYQKYFPGALGKPTKMGPLSTQRGGVRTAPAAPAPAELGPMAQITSGRGSRGHIQSLTAAARPARPSAPPAATAVQTAARADPRRGPTRVAARAPSQASVIASHIAQAPDREGIVGPNAAWIGTTAPAQQMAEMVSGLGRARPRQNMFDPAPPTAPIPSASLEARRAMADRQAAVLTAALEQALGPTPPNPNLPKSFEELTQGDTAELPYPDDPAKEDVGYPQSIVDRFSGIADPFQRRVGAIDTRLALAQQEQQRRSAEAAARINEQMRRQAQPAPDEVAGGPTSILPQAPVEDLQQNPPALVDPGGKWTDKVVDVFTAFQQSPIGRWITQTNTDAIFGRQQLNQNPNAGPPFGGGGGQPPIMLPEGMGDSLLAGTPGMPDATPATAAPGVPADLNAPPTNAELMATIAELIAENPNEPALIASLTQLLNSMTAPTAMAA